MSLTNGNGYAAAHLDDLGEGPGFRKIRGPLGVTAFGVNAIVLPPGYETNDHRHEQQEEVYVVHDGEILMTFGDEGTSVSLTAGSVVRVDAATRRQLKNVGSGEATYFCFGGKDGYVGRDGVLVAEGSS